MTTAEKKPFTAASFSEYLAENKLMGSHCLACDESFEKLDEVGVFFRCFARGRSRPEKQQGQQNRSQRGAE